MTKLIYKTIQDRTKTYIYMHSNQVYYTVKT